MGKKWYGSIPNRIEEGREYKKVEVGMGATELCYTDRHPFTVIEIKSPCRILVQEDTAIRTDDNGMSESQTYTYERNPNGEIRELIKTKKGWKEFKEDTRFLIGYREEYYDYSF